MFQLCNYWLWDNLEEMVKQQVFVVSIVDYIGNSKKMSKNLTNYSKMREFSLFMPQHNSNQITQKQYALISISLFRRFLFGLIINKA